MKNRLGGLARRATYIESLKKEGVPFLHLDAGDVFQSKYDVSETDRPGVMAGADVFINAFERMDVKAVTVGDRDLALGIEALKAIDKKSKFPLLSSNILKDGKPVFAPSIVTMVGGQKVAVIGATTALFVNRQAQEADEGIKVGPPEKTVPAEVARRKAEGATLFILLGHLNETEVKRVAEAAPEIQFVLGGQWLRMDRNLTREGNAWVAGAYMRGKNISVMDLHIKDGSLTFVDKHARLGLEKRARQLELQIRSREQSIERAQKNAKNAKKGPRANQNDYLQQNLVRLKTELQQVKMDLEDLETPDAESSFVTWDLKGMDTTLTDDETTARQVEDYRKVYPDPTKKPAARPTPVKRERIAPGKVPPAAPKALPRRPTRPTSR